MQFLKCMLFLGFAIAVSACTGKQQKQPAAAQSRGIGVSARATEGRRIALVVGNSRNGRNYLIPVGATNDRDADVEIEAVVLVSAGVEHKGCKISCRAGELVP